jgi:hypothetical protein
MLLVPFKIYIVEDFFGWESVISKYSSSLKKFRTQSTSVTMDNLYFKIIWVCSYRLIIADYTLTCYARADFFSSWILAGLSQEWTPGLGMVKLGTLSGVGFVIVIHFDGDRLGFSHFELLDCSERHEGILNIRNLEKECSQCMNGWRYN